jgi:flagellar protein FlaE
MDVSIRTVVESIVGGDESPESEGADGTDESDDLGGLGDDGAGLGGGDEAGDGFGGLDDEGGDLGGDDAGGGNVDELEHRIDEVETELEDLSSTVETVRTENEQISTSVGDVEENVRKLLDIYEMVTNGVNPFADDVEAGAAGGSMGGDFGLFDDENGGDSDGGSEETVDRDVANADPEGFFDEDLDDEDLTVDEEPAVDDVFGDAGDESADATGAGGGDAPSEPTDEGTSFEDLKEEYDAAEAADDSVADSTAANPSTEAAGEPAEPNTDEGRADTREPTADSAEATETTPAASTASDAAPTGASSTGGRVADRSDRSEAPDPPPATAADPPAGTADTGTPAAGEPTVNGGTAPVESAPDQRSAGATPAREPRGPGKPYLGALPSGVATDLLVTEWLEFLVDQAGVREAASALRYYESIGWIGPAVAASLSDRLDGFDGGGSGTLTRADHSRSLRYVSQLDGGGMEAIGLQRCTDGGGSDGVQR